MMENLIPEFNKQINEDFGTGQEEFDVQLDRMEFDVYNPPQEYENYYGALAKIKYDIILDVNSAGISDISITPKSIYVMLSTDEDDLPDDIEIDINEIPFDNYKQDILGMPISITNLEIDMHNSMNQQDWTYELTIGSSRSH